LTQGNDLPKLILVMLQSARKFGYLIEFGTTTTLLGFAKHELYAVRELVIGYLKKPNSKIGSMMAVPKISGFTVFVRIFLEDSFLVS
jgi:hypothetical protein